MSAMEFTWRMVGVLVWPAVILTFLVLYRGWITSALTSAANGRPIKRVKAGPLELEWESMLDAAGRNVAGVLAGTAAPPDDEESVPTNLVDLIPVVARDARRGIRAAFEQVQRALAEVHPQLAQVAPGRLTDAMRMLVRQGAMETDVEWVISQLAQLYEMSESDATTVDSRYAYQFLALAEGAIHAILRSAKAAPAAPTTAPAGATEGPIGSRWQGTYNNSYGIELAISRWDGMRFEGSMSYPGSGTTTDVTGQVVPDAAAGVTVTWRETGYRLRGSRSIDFDGEYRATVSGSAMSGAWHHGTRRIAGFAMVAAAEAETA